MAELNIEGQFDITLHEQIKQHAEYLKQYYSQRDIMFSQIEDIYMMNWDEENKVARQVENVKITRSPRARNALTGAIRLLIAADPIFSVPRDINNARAVAMSEKMEKFATAMWFASGRIAGDPIHYDVVRSGLLYDEIHIGITSTKDLLEYSSDAPAVKARAEEVHAKTPYLFSVMNPTGGYPERGPLGLDAFYSSRSVTVSYILDNFGKLGEAVIDRGRMRDSKRFQLYDNVTLNQFYNLKTYEYWLDEIDRPIIQANLDTPFIPIVAQTVSGSKLFDKPEDQRDPFLYTLMKSGLHNRQNMLLTVLFTMTFAIGSNPMFVFSTPNPDREPDVDWTRAGGMIKLGPGERYESLVKQVIDPSVMQSWNIANELEMESTIYRQTLGEPLGANAPYSMVALLSQSGRLPLVTGQRKSSWGIGEAIDLSFKWMRLKKQRGSASYQNQKYELKPSEIPDQFEVEAKLEISLPQDRLQSVNAANMATGGDDPLASKRWARENLLNIGQSDEMTKEIWDEKVAAIFYRKFVQTQLAMLAQMEQMSMQAPGTGATGMPGMPRMPVNPSQLVMPPAPGTPTMPPTPQETPPLQPIPPVPPIQPPIGGGG